MQTPAPTGATPSVAFDSTFVVRGVDEQPIFLCTADLKVGCMAICLQCGMSRHIVSKNSDSENPSAAMRFANYIYSHLMDSKIKGRSEHDKSTKPSMSDMLPTLRSVLDGQIVPSKRRSIVFDSQHLNQFERLVRDRKLERIEICGECLCERTGSACCVSASIKDVAAYTRRGCCPLLVVDGIEELQVLKQKRDLSTQSPSRRSRGNESIATDSSEPVPFPNLSTTDSKRRKTEPSRIASMFEDICDGKETCLLTNGQNSSLLLRFEGFERTGENHSAAKISESDLLGMGLFENRIWGAIAGGQSLPSLEEATRLASQFPTYDRSDGFHGLMHAAVVSFHEMTQLDIEGGVLTHYELTLIGRLPVIACMDEVSVVMSTRENDARVTSFAEFIPAASTKAIYNMNLTRFLIGIVVNQLLGSALLEKAIEATKTANPSNTEPFDKWDLSLLREAIAILLYSIGTNDTDIAPTYLKSFVFEMRITHELANGDEREEDDILDGEDDEEGVEAQFALVNQGDEEEENQSHLRIAALHTIRKRVSGLLYMLKRAAIYQFGRLKEKQSGVGADDWVARLLASKYRGKPVLPSVAKCISNLNTLVPSSGNDRYLTQLRGDEGPYLTIKISQYEFDLPAFQAAYGCVLTDCRDSFLGLLRDESSFRARDLWQCVCDPRSDVFAITSSKRDNDAAALKIEPSTAEYLHNLFSRRLENDTARFRSDIEEFRDSVIAGVYLYSGSVMRMPELSSLRFRSGVGKGNLFHDITWLGTGTLVYAGIISKTQKEGFAMLCPFVARLVMFLLKVIGPFCSRFVCEEFQACIRNSEGRGSLEDSELDAANRSLKKAANETFTSRIAVQTSLSPSFAKRLRKDPVSAVETISENSFKVLLDRDLRQRIGVNVALRAFGLRDMSVLELRHLLVSHKTNILLYVRAIEQVSTDEDLTQLSSMLGSRIYSSISQEASISALGAIGMHSTTTNQQVYNVKVALPGAEVSLPNSKYISSQYAEAAVAIFARLPMSLPKLADSSGSLVLNGQRQSISEMLGIDPTKESEIGTFLLVKLREILKKPEADWTSDEQARATHSVFTTSSDKVIALGCGSGKTMTFALPFSMAPCGFGVVIVPYRALLESHKIYFDNLGVECLEMTDKTRMHFTPDVFTSGKWTRQTTVRVVVVVTDTAMKQDSLVFFEAALLSGLLLGFVIDECHQLIMSSAYRDVQRRLTFLSSLRAPIILCSGTLPDGFRKSVMAAFSINPLYSDIFSNPISLKHRLIVDLVRSEISSLDAFESYLLDLVARHIQLTKNSRGPILVFCMTRKLMIRLAERAKCLVELSGLKVTTIDSTCSRDDMKTYLKTFEEQQRVLAFSTSFTAEGINYPLPVELVIVAVGTYGGVLMVHQMFSRAGRGPIARTGASSIQPRAMLLYAPKIAIPHVFPSVESMHSDTLAMVIPIVPHARKSVTTIIGFGSHQKLFRDTPLCGALEMERLLNEGMYEPGEGCSCCYGCLKDNWVYPLPPIVESHSREPTESGTMNKNSNPAVQARGRDYVTEKARILTVVHRFLNETTDRCLACGGESHYARDCPKFRAFNVECLMCLSPSHNYRDVQAWLGRDHNKIRSLNVKAWGDWMSESDKREKMDCAIVVARPGATQVTACTRCWFEHIKESNCCIVEGKGQMYSMRVLLTCIWFNKKYRDSFLASMEFIVSSDKERLLAAERTGKGWKSFMHWAVYESTANVQNLYRVVMFWIQNKDWA